MRQGGVVRWAGWGDGFDSLMEEAVSQSCCSGFECVISVSRGECGEQGVSTVCGVSAGLLAFF